MPHLRFTSEAEAQLQWAYHSLNGSPQQPSYDRLVTALARLERDASLFTLLEATSVPGSIPNLYSLVLEVPPPAVAIALTYGLDASSEDVVIFTIAW